MNDGMAEVDARGALDTRCDADVIARVFKVHCTFSCVLDAVSIASILISMGGSNSRILSDVQVSLQSQEYSPVPVLSFSGCLSSNTHSFMSRSDTARRGLNIGRVVSPLMTVPGWEPSSWASQC